MINQNKMTAVEWFAKELYEKFEMKCDGKVFDELLEKAKEMEKEQKHELKEKYFIKGYVGAELDNFIYDDSTELSAKELFNELIKSE